MVADPLNRAFAPTIPSDLNDPPRFGQLVETVKDCLVLELRKFFSSPQITAGRRIEIPTIEKYQDYADSSDPFSSSVTVISKLPNLPEHLPHVSVMAASNNEKKLTIGPPFIGTVQDPPQLISVNPEPYTLQDGAVLAVRTVIKKTKVVVENITFTADRFPTANPITSALAVDVARVINESSEHFTADVVNQSGSNYVVLYAGGPNDTKIGATPLEIEVASGSVVADTVLGFGRRGSATTIGGTKPNLTLTATAGTWSSADIDRYVYIGTSNNPYFNNGRFRITNFSTGGGTDTITFTSKYGIPENPTTATWFIGLRDDYMNPARPPKHRYAMAGDVNVQIDVYTEDPNTRTEIVDLVQSFFGFFLEEKFFTFMGRTGFSGQTAPNEFYQVVINPPMNLAGETEVPRPNDATNKVHCNSFALSTTISMYIDREVYFPGTTTPFILNDDNFVYDDTLPLSGAVNEGVAVVDGVGDPIGSGEIENFPV